MARRGRSTTIGKFAKIEHDRRVSEIRMLGELLRTEQNLVLVNPSTRERSRQRSTSSHTDD